MATRSEKIQNLIIALSEYEGGGSKLAKRIGVSPQHVSNWVNGRNEPRADILVSISKIYGIPIEDLMSNSSVEYHCIDLSPREPLDQDIDEVGACMKKMSDKQRRAVLNVARAMVE